MVVCSIEVVEVVSVVVLFVSIYVVADCVDVVIDCVVVVLVVVRGGCARRWRTPSRSGTVY